MRIIQAKDVLKNKYSIKNHEVIEVENGKYYNKKIAEQIINYEKQNKMDAVKQFKKYG